MSSPRLLFAAWHCWLDPSSGAAISARDLLAAMAGRGWDVRVLCGPRLDFDRAESIEQLVADQCVPVDVRHGSQGPVEFSVLHFTLDGVPCSIYNPASSIRSDPSADEGGPFLALLDRLLDRWRPDVVLTYGGNWLAVELMQSCRRHGPKIVFWLRNFAYKGARLFDLVDGALVPSRCSAEHYREALGICCTAIPSPLDWSRVRCQPESSRHSESACYVTFVNPQPAKGVFVFARIAHELGRRRPDIPLLVVEGRGGCDWLARTGVDFRDVSSLHRMANTPDPRDFYHVSRLVLMPSLWRESFGRVAAEAFLNGIPVLASRRGALPEVLSDAGFLFDVPDRYTPETRIVPTAEEVAPWVETIIRLWDDEPFYEQESRRCLRAAESWRPDRIADRYEAYFRGLLECGDLSPLSDSTCSVPSRRVGRAERAPPGPWE
jgi:glycosyltransferase involved in cell wall biosynthesis